MFQISIAVDESESAINIRESKAYVDLRYRGNELSPQKLTTDFLRCVRQHAETILKEKLPSSVLNSTPIEYVVSKCHPLTLP